MDEHAYKIYLTYGEILDAEVVVKQAAEELWMGRNWGKVPRNSWSEETGFPLSVPRTPLFPAIEWTARVVELSR